MSESWRARAACQDEPIELFFPPPLPSVGGIPRHLIVERRQLEAEARKVCASCPVFAECEEDMLSKPRDYYWDGIVAGTTWTQRKAMWSHAS